eukprot:1178370-Prorocentrum_minimum.AAC.2
MDKWVPNPACGSKQDIRMYRFLGAVMGGVIRTKNVLALDLPPLFWKQLLGEPASLSDLTSVDEHLMHVLEEALHRVGPLYDGWLHTTRAYVELALNRAVLCCWSVTGEGAPARGGLATGAGGQRLYDLPLGGGGRQGAGPAAGRNRPRGGERAGGVCGPGPVLPAARAVPHAGVLDAGGSEPPSPEKRRHQRRLQQQQQQHA